MFTQWNPKKAFIYSEDKCYVCGRERSDFAEIEKQVISTFDYEIELLRKELNASSNARIEEIREVKEAIEKNEMMQLKARAVEADMEHFSKKIPHLKQLIEIYTDSFGSEYLSDKGLGNPDNTLADIIKVAEEEAKLPTNLPSSENEVGKVNMIKDLEEEKMKFINKDIKRLRSHAMSAFSVIGDNRPIVVPICSICNDMFEGSSGGIRSWQDAMSPPVDKTTKRMSFR